jgi:multiple sugar transport system permease protein
MSVGILDKIRTVGQSKKRIERLQSIVIHTVLLIGAVLVFFPVFWMISTSLKPPYQVTKFPPVWLTNPIMLENYYQALTMYKPVPFYIFVQNSFILSLGNVVGTVISNTIVAFAFARLRFRGSRILFLIVLSTMMLPPQITMIPLFVLFSRLIRDRLRKGEICQIEKIE